MVLVVVVAVLLLRGWVMRRLYDDMERNIPCGFMYTVTMMMMCRLKILGFLTKRNMNYVQESHCLFSCRSQAHGYYKVFSGFTVLFML